VFWRDDRLQQVMPVMVALVAPAGASQEDDAPPLDGREIVSAGLVALGDTATDDGMFKRLNLDVLMHTRSDNAFVRIFALQCARALWTAHGNKLVGAWAQCDGYSKYMLTADGWSLCFLFVINLIRVRVGDGDVHR
jgi:U3 small nucleolar RNA-associated protein 10